jgi:hypothetical protein
MSPLSHAAFAKAGEEVRTPNVQLGRLELCQLSYTRIVRADFKIADFRFSICNLQSANLESLHRFFGTVGREGFEPP